MPQNMHALVSTRCGTIRAKNKGRRACAAKTRHQMAQKRREMGVCRQDAAPNSSETQVKNRGEAGGFRHESAEQRALPMG